MRARAPAEFYLLCSLHNFDRESLCSLPIAFIPEVWYHVDTEGEGTGSSPDRASSTKGGEMAA